MTLGFERRIAWSCHYFSRFLRVLANEGFSTDDVEIKILYVQKPVFSFRLVAIYHALKSAYCHKIYIFHDI